MSGAPPAGTRRLRWQFRLPTLLLLMVVAATVSDALLRSPPTETPFGPNLVIRGNLHPAEAGSSVLLEHGPWQVWTRDGRRLVRGQYDRGEPVGRWQYFTNTGRVRLEGMSDDGRLAGTWTLWDDAGHVVGEATFSAEASEPSAPSNRPANGTMQPNAAPVAGAALQSDDATQRSLPLAKPWSNLSWVEQCTAIRRCETAGAVGVPSLLDALQQSPLELRRQAVHALRRVGEPAAAAVSVLSKIAADQDDPLRADAVRALIEIDAARAGHWLAEWCGWVAQTTSEQRQMARLTILRPQGWSDTTVAQLTAAPLAARQFVLQTLLGALKSHVQPASAAGQAWAPPAVPAELAAELDQPLLKYSHYAYNPTEPSDWTQSVERVVALLAAFRHDSDPALRTAATQAVELYRNGDLQSVFDLPGGVF